ncbi:hypothetical protein [Candidatus Mycoplasma haematohominis]|uniref:Uncharacterized protein n=1 Tax=Candidatus Mycoplasma haematohominis TaxID=1494318 RepID=A0A478FQD8_9MOLU|nr:hypothetical protein [Candidatus Mycoplasma haemohominis]GCE63663.1 hypothetical protein MHSWG343_06630 [Candidatus Mycoplasma haemohominis]
MTPQVAGGIVVGTVLVGGTGVGVYMLATRTSDPVTLKQALVGIIDKGDYENNAKLAGYGTNKDVLVADVPENQSWWNARYKEKLEKIKGQDNNRALSSHFRFVDKGYGVGETDAATALNKVCDTAYKLDRDGFKGTEDTDTKFQYRKDVEKFCTVKGTETLQVE